MTDAEHDYAVWAPNATRVRLAVGDGTYEMHRAGDGHFAVRAPVGDYGFLLDDDAHPLPDPRSLRLPNGVHGRSGVFDPSEYRWRDSAWRGLPIEGGVMYELHVGTFTPEGTLDAIAGRFEHLRSIGVTHLELLPVNAFNGTRNWGYDGVAWWAVHEGYGGPAAYQRFVDAAHAAGFAVVQDVVYNHLGPSGNYLPRFGPYFAREGRSTWGEHINLGSAEVREYILGNVEYWLRDMHVDALRLDAVHALVDSSQTHILAEMSQRVAALSAATSRHYELIAESDLNDSAMITPLADGNVEGRAALGIDAQWSDDWHHAVHVALTGETAGYYADFVPLSALQKVLERGFFHDGTRSSFRARNHGHPINVERVFTSQLVVSAQNHDQVGNRARGDRLTEALSDSELGIAALLLYAGPFTPMLFMGEEFAAATPFQFFTSHPEDDLGRAVAEGRVLEFARMGWDESVVPDPQDAATFARSKLDWGSAAEGRHAAVLAMYRQLAQLRAELPALRASRFADTTAEVDEDARTLTMRRGDATVFVNFGAELWEVPLAGGSAAALRFATSAAVHADAGVLRLPSRTAALLAPTV